jgi:hypothetical protein
MRSILALAVGAALLGLASSAKAQGDDNGFGYVALITTPSAGVTPIVRQWMLRDPSTRMGIDAQWGHLDGNGANFDMVTGGLTFPTSSGKADYGVSAGYGRPNCAGCPGYLVAGGVYEGSLEQSTGTASVFTVGLNGRLGYARSQGTSYWSGSVGVPLSLAFGQGNAMRIVPFLTPALGVGHIGSDLSATGVRLLVGGGIGVLSQSAGIGGTLGFQRILADGSKTVFGLGMSILPH